MNKQIQEFMQQAGTDVSGKWMSVDNATKFAELIVRECLGKVAEAAHARRDPFFAYSQILEHFGVEL